MLKSKIAGLSILCSALFSLPASAAYTQVIDDFESGTLGSRWSVLDGVYPADIDVYNAISSYYDFGEGPKLYYPPQGSWMAVLRAGEPLARIATGFTSLAGGVLDMQVFFSANEAYIPEWGIPGVSYNDFAQVKVDGSEIFFADVVSTGIHGYGLDNTGWLDVSVPLAAGHHTLEILVQNDGGEFTIDSQIAVDNIRMTYAVPEPSTYTMMLSALGLVGFAAYRRRDALSRIEG
jgi:hypothetical protein